MAGDSTGDDCIGCRPVLMGFNLIFVCLIVAFGAQLSKTYKMESFSASTDVQCRLNNFAFVCILVYGSFDIISTLGYCCWRLSLRNKGLSCADGSPNNSRIVAKSWMLPVLHVVAVIVNVVSIWTMKVAPNGVAAVPSFARSDSHTTSVTTTTTTANPIDTCNCFEYIENVRDECTKYSYDTLTLHCDKYSHDFSAPGFWVATSTFLVLSLSTHALALLLWIYAFVMSRGKPMTEQEHVPLTDAAPIPMAEATPIPMADAIPIAATSPADSYGGHLHTATTPVAHTDSNPAHDKSSVFENF